MVTSNLLAHFPLLVLSDTQGQQCQYFIFTLLYASIFVDSMCVLLLLDFFHFVFYLLFSYYIKCVFNDLFPPFPTTFGRVTTPILVKPVFS